MTRSVAGPVHHGLTLPDGRLLAWAEYGAAGGSPVLYLHGAPSCRLEVRAAGGVEPATALGVRLISPDRPGLGRSDPLPGRTVATWAADVRVLADQLGLERFAVLGCSGGAGYAVATALAVPERVSHLGLVSPVVFAQPGLEDGLDPGSLALRLQARDEPDAARRLLGGRLSWPGWVAPWALAPMIRSRLPEPDRRAFTDSGFAAALPALVRETFRQGTEGPRLDLALTVADWDVDPTLVRAATTLWAGQADTVGARPAMAEYLHRRIPGSTLRLTDDGHLGVLTTRWREILTRLVGTGP